MPCSSGFRWGRSAQAETVCQLRPASRGLFPGVRVCVHACACVVRSQTGARSAACELPWASHPSSCCCTTLLAAFEQQLVVAVGSCVWGMGPGSVCAQQASLLVGVYWGWVSSLQALGRNTASHVNVDPQLAPVVCTPSALAYAGLQTLTRAACSAGPACAEVLCGSCACFCTVASAVCVCVVG
jgi:hypothetical protein